MRKDNICYILISIMLLHFFSDNVIAELSSATAAVLYLFVRFTPVAGEIQKFNYRKFSSGYYKLITRSGHAAEFVSVTGDKHVSANVPGIPSCRGIFWYGYDFNGNYKLVGESPLDLFMVRKGFWQVVHVFFLKLFGKYSV